MSRSYAFQKKLIFSHFEWTNALFSWIINKPKHFVLVMWLAYFLYDFITSLFLPYDLKIIIPLMHFFFGIPLILFLFLEFYPSCKGKKNLAVISIQLIDIILLLSLLKYLILYQNQLISILDRSEAFLLETYRLMHFAFFTLVCWSFREFILGVKKNFEIRLMLSEVQISHDHLSLSPHFMFNALNNIAGKSLIYSDELFQHVSAFSTLMKEAYKNPHAPHFLDEELVIIDTLLFFVKRQSKKVYLQIQIEPDFPLEYFKIPRLLLATLIENILKYGEYSDRNNPAVLTIKLCQTKNGYKYLVCTSFNLIKPNVSKVHSGHGLQTLTRIINHFYKHHGFFQWSKTEDEFSTLLIVPYEKDEDSTD
ncbi:histidine kinase [Algoriphagus pacificus]|uniref:Histidine kinase n=1 Tax=Algoriphagus pacificus TaxID=2811234 RepID=A0ABS3CKY3_9BACT|nr:histidine kinase [Algoriphagus pacificus]MBN7817768.1 histidine kinase [Algoriphagus pacificus]